MGNTKTHTQGNGVRHLTEVQHNHATQEASRPESGLMPPAVVFEGVWYKPPASFDAPGRPGMKAFDEEYVYLCVSLNIWRRIQLREWLV